MSVFLILSLCSSATLLLMVTLMQRSAIRRGQDGGKRFILLAGFVLSALATIPVAALILYVGGATSAGMTLLGAAVWHFAAFKLASRWIESAASGQKAETQLKA